MPTKQNLVLPYQLSCSCAYFLISTLDWLDPYACPILILMVIGMLKSFYVPFMSSEKQCCDFYYFQESMVRGKQSAIVPFRRSLRLCHNQNSQNAFSMDQNHESSSRRSQKNTVVKLSMRMVSHKDSQKIFCQDSQGIPPRIRVPDLSCKKTQKEELNSNCCEKLARKRKRGTEERMSSSKRQSHKDPKSLSLKCQESTPTNKPRNTSHKKGENNSSSMPQPKFCDGRLMNAERNNKELNGSERRETQCGLNNWTEEQDMALRKAYFTARPSPNFWKKVSKMVLPILLFCCFSASIIYL